jgi:hypothetical protein
MGCGFHKKMGENNFKKAMERQTFRESEKQADVNISKIFNPENAYKRKQKEILNNIFGDEKW